MNLTTEDCVACRVGAPVATESEIAAYMPVLPDWRLETQDGVRRLVRVVRCRDFATVIALATCIADESERQGHHPVMTVEWGRLTVQWWTHKIDGLHRNDFIMAARTDQCVEALGLVS